MSDLNSCHQSSKINSAIGETSTDHLLEMGCFSPSFLTKPKRALLTSSHAWDLPHTPGPPTARLLGQPAPVGLTRACPPPPECSLLRASTGLTPRGFPAREGAAAASGGCAVQERVKGDGYGSPSVSLPTGLPPEPSIRGRAQVAPRHSLRVCPALSPYPG